MLGAVFTMLPTLPVALITKLGELAAPRAIEVRSGHNGATRGYINARAVRSCWMQSRKSPLKRGNNHG